MFPWSDVEAAVLLAAAFVLQHRDSTISRFLRRLHRRYPRVTTFGFAGLVAWFAAHIRHDPDERTP